MLDGAVLPPFGRGCSSNQPRSPSSPIRARSRQSASPLWRLEPTLGNTHRLCDYGPPAPRQLWLSVLRGRSLGRLALFRRLRRTLEVRNKPLVAAETDLVTGRPSSQIDSSFHHFPLGELCGTDRRAREACGHAITPFHYQRETSVSINPRCPPALCNFNLRRRWQCHPGRAERRRLAEPEAISGASSCLGLL